MSASAPPPPRSEEEGASLVVRFGAALGLATAASLVCSAPAALRLSAAVAAGQPGQLGLRLWLALAASALGPMVAAIIVLRGAAEGMRAFVGPGAWLRAFGAGVWIASLLVALTWFGSLLRATTHHHALAGVTYAFGALVIAVGLGLVSLRLVSILGNLSPAARSLAFGGLGGAVVVVLAAMAVRFVRAASHDSASAVAAATVVDVFAFALAGFLASRRTLGGPRILALVGPPLAVVILATGISSLRDEAIRQAIADRAPAFAPAASLVSGR
jgi:hypothetical protein